MIRGTGFIQSTRDGSLAADFNRLTSDGDIIRFQKDGSPKGTIGTNSYGEYNISSEANLTLTQKNNIVVFLALGKVGKPHPCLTYRSFCQKYRDVGQHRS